MHHDVIRTSRPVPWQTKFDLLRLHAVSTRTTYTFFDVAQLFGLDILPDKMAPVVLRMLPDGQLQATQIRPQIEPGRVAPQIMFETDGMTMAGSLDMHETGSVGHYDLRSVRTRPTFPWYPLQALGDVQKRLWPPSGPSAYRADVGMRFSQQRFDLEYVRFALATNGQALVRLADIRGLTLPYGLDVEIVRLTQASLGAAMVERVPDPRKVTGAAHSLWYLEKEATHRLASATRPPGMDPLITRVNLSPSGCVEDTAAATDWPVWAKMEPVHDTLYLAAVAPLLAPSALAGATLES